jgi:hypothetical protein
MKEDFLHYLWKFKKFDFSDLKTSNGEAVTIINCGQYLQKAGPDFFNAQITIDNQKWAGNVEIHVKSSDWYVHHHERDESYENVILHVVWEHDTEIFRKNNTEIPVLVLQNYVSKSVLENYKALISPKSWIFCEKQLTSVDTFAFKNWQERLFFERLERKSKPIQELLEATNQDWETVLFCLLAKNFGLNTNGELFLEIAQNISFPIIRKEGFELENLEALLFGFAGFLETEREDTYYKDLKFRFYYLLQKYQLERKHINPVQFFQHRPDNFPTIRLSQLANLYFNQQNLFSKLIAATTVNTVYDLLAVSVSEYWQTHYQFDKISPKKKKALSKSFIDLIVINTIVPIQFAYAKSKNKDISEELISLLNQVAPESNAIIQKFATFGIKSKSAFDTQSLLQLKNEYCNKSQCLSCAVGAALLSGK